MRLLERAHREVLSLTVVPGPDPAPALEILDDALATARDGSMGIGAHVQLLRYGVIARLLVAAGPGADTSAPGVDTLLAAMHALARDHGLTLFVADVEVLAARRALLAGDEDAALTAMSTALGLYDEPVLVDHAPDPDTHQANLCRSLRMAAGTMVSFGLHDIADSLLDRAGGTDVVAYERVRTAMSWALRLERAGHRSDARMREAAAAADRLRGRGRPEQRPLVLAAAVLARTHDGSIDPDLARREASTLFRTPLFAGQHDRLLGMLAGARALEHAGEISAAVRALEAVRAQPPGGEAALMLSVTREIARLRAGLASGCDAASAAAKEAFRHYTAELESELWELHQARVQVLRARIAHDRLRREHGQVAALALSDPLTGLPNRRALDRALDDALRATTGDGAPVAVAMVDVDRFKLINDRVSHARGDEVLRLVAGALRSTLRAPDLVARYGGDEFVVVLPGTGAGDAGAALARAGRAVAGLPSGEGTRSVTLSVGVVEVRPPETAAEALARADAVMYAVKRAGGDAVRVVEPAPPGPPEATTDAVGVRAPDRSGGRRT